MPDAIEDLKSTVKEQPTVQGKAAALIHGFIAYLEAAADASTVRARLAEFTHHAPALAGAIAADAPGASTLPGAATYPGGMAPSQASNAEAGRHIEAALAAPWEPAVTITGGVLTEAAEPEEMGADTVVPVPGQIAAGANKAQTVTVAGATTAARPAASTITGANTVSGAQTVSGASGVSTVSVAGQAQTVSGASGASTVR
jgi:hypothetical protein